MDAARCLGFLSLAVWALGGVALGNVVLYGSSVSLSFDDMEASFGPAIKLTGERGKLYLANPIDACSHLSEEVDDVDSPFALILRGGCTFDEKVRNAQKAGFKAAIVYDNEVVGPLISMAGNSDNINIPSVFVSKSSGDAMKIYAGVPDIDLFILPVIDDSPWSLMAISFVTLIALAAVLAICCFVRSHHITRQHTRNTEVVCLPRGMSSRLVKALPTLVFTEVMDDCCTSMTCAFCLEDYHVGDRLRVLPCQHKFHATCVDSWLTEWRTFCPMCKRDVRASIDKPPATESTPLLSPVNVSLTPTAALTSFHSSVGSSSAIQIVPSLSRSSLTTQIIAPSPTQSLVMSRTHSISSTPRIINQPRSYNNSPAMSINSPAEMWNLSSQRSHVSYLMSSHSLGHGLPPSMSSRFASPCANYSGNGSPSYLVGSSSRQSYLRHNESANSLSAFASSHSLVEI